MVQVSPTNPGDPMLQATDGRAESEWARSRARYAVVTERAAPRHGEGALQRRERDTPSALGGQAYRPRRRLWSVLSRVRVLRDIDGPAGKERTAPDRHFGGHAGAVTVAGPGISAER
jgi:hypothetical protein